MRNYFNYHTILSFYYYYYYHLFIINRSKLDYMIIYSGIRLFVMYSVYNFFNNINKIYDYKF